MHNIFFTLAFSSIFCSISLASPLATSSETFIDVSQFTPISYNELSMDSDDIFIDCPLEDNRVLFANDAMVIIGDQILAKSRPLAFKGNKGQYAQYKDWQYEVVVAKQIVGYRRRQSVQIIQIDTTPHIVESFFCK